MSNYAKIEIRFSQNWVLNDIFSNLRIEQYSSVLYSITEVCFASRIGSGTFKRETTLEATLTNLRNAIFDDFITPNGTPLLCYTEASSGSSIDKLVIEATEYGFEFVQTGFTVPSYATVVDTPEVTPDFEYDTVVVSEASSSPTAMCKQTINLLAGKVGVPPYTLYTPFETLTGLTAAQLIAEVERNDGFEGKLMQLVDDIGVSIDVPIGGLQSSGLSVISLVSFDADSYVAGTVIIGINLEQCNSNDQEIILELGLYDPATSSVIEAYREVYNDANGGYATYTFSNVPLINLYLMRRDNFGAESNLFLPITAPVPETGEFIVKYMRSNSLNMINKAEYLNAQTTDNRLHCDIEYKNRFKQQFYQKYLQTSNLWIQFQTSYQTTEVYLIDSSFNWTDISSQVRTVYIKAGISWLNIEPVLTGLDGYYQIMTVFKASGEDDVTYISEKFEVRESFDRIVTMNWYNTDIRYGYQDGIYWEEGNKQEMLIDAEFIRSDPAEEKTIQEDSNNRVNNLKTFMSKIDMLRVYRMADYMKERFRIAMGHYKVEINNIEYMNKDAVEFKPFEGDNLNSGELELRRVNYEIY